MAGSFSDFLELEVLDHVFGAAAYTAPTTTYYALYTTAPTDTGGGTEVGTGTWTTYARVAVTNNATNYPAASAGAKSNGAIISWGTATMDPTTATVVVTALGIFDAATDGNLLAWSDLTIPKTLNHSDPITIPIGDLDITLS